MERYSSPALSARVPNPPREKQTLVEYDGLRVGARMSVGLLAVLGFIATAHGYSKGWRSIACSGTWEDTALFFACAVSAMAIIEISHWSVWRVVHRKEILPSEARQALIGRSSGTPPADYDLVLSGGRLALAPMNPFLAVTVGCVLLIGASVLGFPNPCKVSVFTWRAVGSWFLSAYASLMFGTILENRLKRDKA
jgi:hypothetical protein